ncbi:MAG TPA: sigma-70 family RNA polymerase sigma factor [Urbifossiella sp.]|nr:sigma-70 family RNA polymerase sigma factor [Urbifossiella sp.]
MTTTAVRRGLSRLSDPPDTRTDAELLRDYLAGDRDRAFGVLVRRHGPVVLAVCRRALGNAADADDAFQAVFLRLARRGGSIRDARALPAWLHRVAVRVSRRALARRRPAPLPGDVADPADPLGGVVWRDLRRVLDEELDRLPERLRTPVLLCLFDGLTRDEAAVRLGVSLNTARRRVDAGRDLLRARLLRRGVGPATVVLAALDPAGLRAAVPAALAAATVGFGGGGTAPVPPAVEALAATAPPRLAWAALLSVVLAASGVAVMATPRGSDQPPAPTPPAAPAPAAENLPAGALRRFADDRFRHPGYLAAAAVSADGRRVATVSSDLLQIADLDTGLPLRRIPLKHDGYGYYGNPGLAFSPDGKYVACVLNDKLTAAWETDTGREVLRLPERKHGYALCQFTPDGKLLLQDADRLRLLDLASGKEVGVRPLRAGVLTPDAAVFARAEERESVVLGDAVTGRVTHRLAVSTASNGFENGLAFSPDGRRLAVVHDRREVQVWDVAAGTKTATVPVPADAVVKNDPSYAVGFSGDGEVVHFGTAAGVIHRWRVATGAELPAFRIPHGHHVRLMHPAADGRTVVTADANGTVTRWDAETGARVGAAAGYTRPIRAAIVAPGKQLVIADQAGRIDLWDAATGKVVRPLAAAGRPVTALDVAPDGRLAAVGGDGGEVRLVRLADGHATPLHPTTPKAGHARLHRFSPDGALLLAGDWGKEMRVFDVAAGRVLWTDATVSAAAFGTEGRLVWGRYKVFGVTDARTGESLREKKLELPGGDGFFNTIQAVAAAPNGRRVACAVPDGEVLILDTFGREVKRFVAADRRFDPYRWKYPSPEYHQLRCLAFSPDGRWLLTGGEDRSVRVWDAVGGREVRRFDGHLGSVEQVAFTPDGASAVSVGDDGAAYLWAVPPAP